MVESDISKIIEDWHKAIHYLAEHADDLTPEEIKEIETQNEQRKQSLNTILSKMKEDNFKRQ